MNNDYGYTFSKLNYDRLGKFNDPSFKPYGESTGMPVIYFSGSFYALYEGMEFYIANLNSVVDTGIVHGNYYEIQLYVDDQEEGVAVLIGEINN